MNLPFYISRLRNQAEAITQLVSNIDNIQARLKPAPEEWSILEVINHLYDEEVEDFRIRLKLTLDNPQHPWPPNEVDRKVIERDYNGKDIDTSLKNFLNERAMSISWLQSLESPHWDNEHVIPRAGSLRAGDLLVSWVAHDLLHIRQLVELHFYYQNRLAEPYSLAYAGDW